MYFWLLTRVELSDNQKVQKFSLNFLIIRKFNHVWLNFLRLNFLTTSLYITIIFYLFNLNPYEPLYHLHLISPSSLCWTILLSESSTLLWLNFLRLNFLTASLIAKSLKLWTLLKFRILLDCWWLLHIVIPLILIGYLQPNTTFANQLFKHFVYRN